MGFCEESYERRSGREGIFGETAGWLEVSNGKTCWDFEVFTLVFISPSRDTGIYSILRGLACCTGPKSASKHEGEPMVAFELNHRMLVSGYHFEFPSFDVIEVTISGRPQRTRLDRGRSWDGKVWFRRC